MKIVQYKEDAKNWIKSVKLEKEVYRQSVQSCPCGGEHICVEMTKSEDSFVVCAKCWEQASSEERIMNPYMARKRRERYFPILHVLILIGLFVFGVISFPSSQDDYNERIQNYIYLTSLPLCAFMLWKVPFLLAKRFFLYAPPIYIWQIRNYKDDKYTIEAEYIEGAQTMAQWFLKKGESYNVEFVREMTKAEVFHYDPMIQRVLSAFNHMEGGSLILMHLNKLENEKSKNK